MNAVVVTAANQQGNPAPRYPNALRFAGIEGSVTVRFASDASGAVDVGTINVVQATNDEFAAAVKSALQQWRLEPNTFDANRFRIRARRQIREGPSRASELHPR